MDTITIIIKELKSQHKTQKDLMEFLNAHPNVFSEWKAGRSKSYTKYIYQIAAFLNVSPDYLLGKTEERQKENPHVTPYDERVKKIMEIVNQLPEEGLDALVPILEQMKKAK